MANGKPSKPGVVAATTGSLPSGRETTEKFSAELTAARATARSA